MSGRNVARTKDPSLQQTSDVNIERIIIDISDYVQFMVRAGSVSGIQRVVAAIANEETDPERIVFCVRAKKAFWYIPYDKGMKPIEAIQSFIDYRRALLLCRDKRARLKTRWRAGKLAWHERRRRGRRPLSFKREDQFLILGAAWDRHELLSALRREKKEVGFSVVAFVHDAIPYFGDEFVSRSAFQNFRSYLQWLNEVADRILCNSNYTKQDLVRTGLVDIARDALVIPLAHELPAEITPGNRKIQALFAKERPARSILMDELTRWGRKDFVLCVGTIEARKNQLLLVRAWAELSQERAMPQLVLAGKMGHQSEPVMMVLEREKPPIAVIDNVSDALLIELYQRCLFTVFPSRFEGWGLPIGESLWFGKRCLASSATSMPEVGGPHAVYFDPHSLPDLKIKIVSLLDEPQGAEPVSRETLRTWKRVAADIIRGASRTIAKVSRERTDD